MHVRQQVYIFQQSARSCNDVMIVRTTSCWLLCWFLRVLFHREIHVSLGVRLVVADSQAETEMVTEMSDSMAGGGENDGPASNGATSRLAGVGLSAEAEGIRTENFRPKLSAVPEDDVPAIKRGVWLCSPLWAAELNGIDESELHNCVVERCLLVFSVSVVSAWWCACRKTW